MRYEMDQIDWVGGIDAKKFRDIGNKRSSTAAEKAQLCLLIKDACRKIPDIVRSGGSIETRAEVEIRSNDSPRYLR